MLYSNGIDFVPARRGGMGGGGGGGGGGGDLCGTASLATPRAAPPPRHPSPPRPLAAPPPRHPPPRRPASPSRLSGWGGRWSCPCPRDRRPRTRCSGACEPCRSTHTFLGCLSGRPSTARFVCVVAYAFMRGFAFGFTAGPEDDAASHLDSLDSRGRLRLFTLLAYLNYTAPQL